MQLIRKRWQGHNDALLARQIRTSSGATNLPERVALPARVVVVAVAPPEPEAPRLAPLWLLDAERAELSEVAERLMATLEQVARDGGVMPIEDEIVRRVGGVTVQSIRNVYRGLEAVGFIRRRTAGAVRSIDLVQLGLTISNRAAPRLVTA